MEDPVSTSLAIVVPEARVTLGIAHDGVQAFQYLVKFPNMYGASISRHPGLWELAVIRWENDFEWHLNYSTAVTDDVLGHLTENTVLDVLLQIKALQREG